MPGIVRAYLFVPSILPSGEIKAKKVILAEDAVYNEAQAKERVAGWKDIYCAYGNIPHILYEYVPPVITL